MIGKSIAFAAAIAIAAPAFATATVGQPAPDFIAADANGKPVKLSGFRGKTVVLEWNNPGCPFVQKHYDSGNMQKTQAAAKAQGVVWLTINSGAPGKQGYMTGAEAQAFEKKEKAEATAYLLDPKGIVGKLYDAKTTPHMYVIDPAGTLVYAGAIDDKPTADQADITTARNHVLAALADVKAGKPVAVATSKPYGCSVKYAG
ncbi:MULTISPECIES: thioredoxin family protein [Sphingomonadales]|uniref:AhpC/TSA family protein n=1 Tax=Edaphosphingomonas haloaromaticamans TaxID=653954 RepID=A0A1S1HCK1_9SPHN|nr:MULTISPECIES: thioredoxin family protein [Sphingomonas]AGH50998.1 alkyl hydroperoxide reductase/ thiol specific antioxidant/ Mal allergen [Sphingomonas sp. MM-1]MDX3885260.1 thioredoxin family protein [Sphingomonas sp.]OHT19552.1 AhpC/TSA family protein [Sphingomonas haloaromaticamans]